MKWYEYEIIFHSKLDGHHKHCSPEEINLLSFISSTNLSTSTVTLSGQNSRLAAMVRCLAAGSTFTQQLILEQPRSRLHENGPFIYGKDDVEITGQSESNYTYMNNPRITCTEQSESNHTYMNNHRILGSRK